jgi:hypothetical protein
MDENIILKLSIKIGFIVILVISQIIAYKYAKAKPPKVEIENTENGTSIKIYAGNKLVLFLNQYLIPIIIVIFSLCIFDIIYLLTNFELNILEKIISIVILLYIAYIIYIKINLKGKEIKYSLSKKTIFFGIMILIIGIFLIIIRFINIG